MSEDRSPFERLRETVLEPAVGGTPRRSAGQQGEAHIMGRSAARVRAVLERSRPCDGLSDMRVLDCCSSEVDGPTSAGCLSALVHRATLI